MAAKLKLLYLITEDWYFVSHRLSLARAALASGFEVALATRIGKHRDEIEAAGIRLIPLGWDRTGTNPWRESRTLMDLVAIYRREKPDVAHHVAVKPVVYGSLAAALSGVPVVVNALAGLGFAFASNRPSARLLRVFLKQAYRLLLDRRGSWLILQNPDDAALFVHLGLVNGDKIALVRGVGVNPDEYRPNSEPEGPVTVVLPARMLWDKGVGEFVAAARLLRAQGLAVRCVLCGETDPANPAAVPPARLADWQREGDVECWGWQENMRDVYARAHIVCLPSYREGLPKALIEAAACGKPLIATNVPGCREVVKDEDNGLLVSVQDAASLAAAIRRLALSAEDRRKFGARSRQRALDEFTEQRSIAATLKLYRPEPVHSKTKT